jgi:hypothetical protein
MNDHAQRAWLQFTIVRASRLVLITDKLFTNKEHPDLVFIDRVQQFLLPYRDWPIGDFGPDELFSVQEALQDYRYGKSYLRLYF